MKSTSGILQAAKAVKSLPHNRDNAVALLQEYTAKLDDFASQARALRTRAAGESAGASDERLAKGEDLDFLRSVLKDRVDRLSNQIQNLSRATSQIIEHGRFDAAIDRVELQVRLADLEGALIAAQDLVRHPLPRSKKKA
jgi:hypothetical protein